MTPPQALVVPRPCRGRRGRPCVIPASALAWSPARHSAATWARRWAHAGTCSHAWPRRRRRPAGRGAPAHRRRAASGCRQARLWGLPRPGDARRPVRRLRPRGRARVAGAQARGRCRRSASAPRGTQTILPPRHAPATWHRRRGRRGCPARRAVCARRCRRWPARRAASTPPGSTPGAAHPRRRPPPSRPAASPLTTRASGGQPHRGGARGLPAGRTGSAPAGRVRARGRGAAPVVNPGVPLVTPSSPANNRGGRGVVA
jgi:hypothetical protein